MLVALRLFGAAIAIYLLYFHGLGDVGLLGPDEPRYASVGREMFFSGDWITPRLAGEAWFEKPPLEYWGIAIAYTLGFEDDLAPRLFNAFCGALFAAFFYWILRREFDARTAAIATAILATSAAWIAESRVAVMDLPLAAAFSAAMLLALSERFVLAAIFLALAVLAKGPVAIVLALPMLWFFRSRWRDLALPLIVFLALVQPWYIAMGVLHGRPFFAEFFLRHNLSRFAESSLQHVQPFWFFVPVMLAAIFPWTPLAALIRWPLDRKQKLLFVWFAWTLLFFSLSRNKLPGYILPAVPPLCALAGMALAAVRRPLLWAAGCGALLGFAAIITDILPAALSGGVRSADLTVRFIPVTLVTLAGIAAGLWQGWRGVAATILLLVPLTIHRLFPVLEHRTSARGLWQTIEARRNDVCIESLHRAWRYGLDFYAIEPLPDCSAQPKRVRLRQTGSERPEILVEPRTAFPGPTTMPDPGAF